MTTEEKIIEQAKNYIRLVITDKCNLNCYYCHGEKMERTGNYEFSVDEILDMLKIAANEGVNKLKVTGGEPLCYPDIFYLLTEANKFIDEVGITSNGTFIEKYKNQISNLPRDIRFNITLNTLDKLEYIKITGKDELDKTVEGINILNNLGFPLKVNMIVRKKNLNQIPLMISLVKNKNIVLKLMDLVDSKSKEFVSKKDIFIYLTNHYILKDKYSDMYCRMNINGTTIQLPQRVYGKNCLNCSIYPCSEGFLSIRLSNQGVLKHCFKSKSIYKVNASNVGRKLNIIRNQINSFS